MTGTTDLSAAQWAAIQRSIEETSSTITRVVLHPITDQSSQAVRVVFHVLGYGTVQFAVERDGKRVPAFDGQLADELRNVTGLDIQRGVSCGRTSVCGTSGEACVDCPSRSS